MSRLLLGAVSAAALLPASQSRAAPLIGACTDLGVSLPTLQSPAPIVSGLGILGLDNALNGIVNGVNQSVITPLSNVSLRVGVLDANGTVVSASAPGQCNLGVSGIGLDASRGVSIGGGRIDGLGSLTGGAAVAADPTAIAIGNGSTTGVGSTNAVAFGSGTQSNAAGGIALGLRSRVDGNDAVAVGTDSRAISAGGVALGAGSLATRAGLGGGVEAFSRSAVTSSAGAVSIGTAGAERQIVHVAGATQATDAVNLRQLSSVGGRLAGAIGGGAVFDPATGIFSAPSFAIRGTTHTDVGSALGAIDTELGRTSDRIDTVSREVSTLQAEAGGGLVTQVTPLSPIRVGSATGGPSIDVSGTAGPRRVTGLADGAGATDAVNLRQLSSVGGRLAGAIGGGAAFDPATGVFSAPSFAIRGTTHTDVGSALGAIDTELGRTSDRIDTVSREVSTLQAGAGGGGLVTQVTPLSPIRLGSATGGPSIDVSGTAGPRRVTGLADGAGATDAVNLRQLWGVGGRLTASLGGGAGFDGATGAFTGPSYVIRGSIHTDVGSAFGAVDTELARTANRLDTVTREVETLRLGTSAGGNTLVTQATPSAAIRVGSTTGGTSVDVSGATDPRRIIGVAQGIDGTDAVNRGQLEAALQTVDARFSDIPLGADNTRGAAAPIAGGRDSYASGHGARAMGTNSLAVGSMAAAQGTESTSVGVDSQASADGASAFGSSANAGGTNGTAVGRLANAGGSGASAIGANSMAQGTDSVALGRGAAAAQDNAVAIGAGAATTRSNQVAIGSAGSSYTLAGIGSAQSRAAQDAATRFVTADASGNLATSDYGPASIAGLQGQIGALGNQVSGLSQYVMRSNREARQGIAAAMAMTSASMPSLPGKTSWTMNAATFRGEWAGGVAIAHRLDAPIPIALTAGFSYSEVNRQGARVGLAGEF